MGNDFTLLELYHRVAAQSEMSRLFLYIVFTHSDLRNLNTTEMNATLKQ